MRKLLAASLVLASLSALVLFSTVQEHEPLPQVGVIAWPHGYDLFAEPACQRVVLRVRPDFVWTTPDWPAPDLVPTRFVDLTARRVGDNVRVGGILHLEFEFSGLFATWGAADHHPENAVRVSMGSFWNDEPYWLTKWPVVDGRCAVIEGTVASISPPAETFVTGVARLRPVRRIEVWSKPFHPVIVFDPGRPPLERP